MKPEVMTRMQQYFLEKYQGIPMCINCEHFRLHYIRIGTTYVSVNGGHCLEPRIKPREAWDLCDFFTPREASAPAPEQTK